jgi:hypothetical protein
MIIIKYILYKIGIMSRNKKPIFISPNKPDTMKIKYKYIYKLKHT